MSDLDTTKQSVRERFPEVRQLQVDELLEQLDSAAEENRPFLIDARGPEEFAVSHLSGAIRAEGDEVVEVARNAGDRPIVVYCAVGFRSSKAVKKLMDAGFKDVANLEGSIFQWANEGHPVERDGKPVNQVHPFDEKWGLMLNKDLWAFTASSSD